MEIIGSQKILIGWKEWCSLPELKIPAVKAKIDTGAKTSCIHAINIEPFKKNTVDWVHFTIDPIQGDDTVLVKTNARIVDKRLITSSNGHKELRYIIHTTLRLGEVEWPIDISLSNRESMRFKMLLGRDALKHHTLIDPVKMHCHGKFTKRQVKRMYGA
ncbi:MAG: ATP-dependent zinc protease [Gammaproteobacteria bacterium CG11_big_fil_rev_8_21_14_0_20_46_22]|nr:MAG: ATP-dependent zinc protease [Gammaproteobacteria bacterium CG12_big_fil_rev_8_21_14_0_65_46_12]PIR10781.1 MAG: ATP-dependent zinc protease [Gammaproteobacteria bacterium CG11_big_fil_rev_8_21_14_0_20_46_22]